MKLHLPKKFQTALMAAFATVSFTTVSTASLGAAIFAFAGYQAAAEEATTTEQSEADKEGQEEIRDNIRILQEKQDEENERETTVDPVDWDVMERRAKNLERAGDAAASGLAKEAYEQMEAEIFTPATSAAPAQQQASTGSGELPSDDLGFTTNPYATTTSGNSEPVFEVTPAAPAADFLLETSTEQESTSPSSSGSSTPASASSSGFGSSANSGYVPFGHVSSNSIPLGVSAIPLGAGDTPQLTPLGDAVPNGTNLVWKGDGQSQGTWKEGGEAEESPWITYGQGGDEVRTAFNRDDFAQFTKSANVTVSGEVHAGSLQIDPGTVETNIIVTINTPTGTSLVTDHTVANGLDDDLSGFTNKIVKIGDGSVNFGVDDPNLRTQLDIQAGYATITFNQLSGDQQNYFLSTRLSAADEATVTIHANGKGSTANSVYFDPSAQVSGVDNFVVEEGIKLHFDTNSEVSHGLFRLNQATTTIQLNGVDSGSDFEAKETELTANHLNIEGHGGATFHTLNWQTTGTTDHAISGTVETKVETLNYYGDVSTVRVDDNSSLAITDLYMNKAGEGNNTFFLAFQNDNDTEGYRQYVGITNMYVDGTAHIGSASQAQAGQAGYQEGGDFDIEVLYGTKGSRLVMENNIQGSAESTCLTEVFYIGPGYYRQEFYNGTFTDGYLQLTASNDGTESNRKQTVLVLRDAYTTQYNTWELKDDAQHADYAIALDVYSALDQPHVYASGIRDIEGYKLKDGNTAMIYSGRIAEGKGDVCESDGISRLLYIYATETYDSSFGVSENIDIRLTGEGSQTFSGSFKDFNGDIWVGGDSSSGTLSILEQATAVNIKDLTIRQQAVLNVKNQDGKNQDAIVNDTLLAMGGSTENGVGTASVLNGDLTLAATSTLDVSAAGGVGGLNLTGELTIAKGAVSLSNADWAAVGKLGWFEMYDLAFGVTDVFGLGESIDWSVGVDATTVFANMGLNKEEYYVRYSGVGTAGGNGSNVGTVYIYRIPEPTTGTLSLLALAALAARRRRK